MHQVWAAGDVGSQIINPNAAESMAHGGIMEGMGHMGQEITLKDGQIQQSNFYDFPLMSMSAGTKDRSLLAQDRLRTDWAWRTDSAADSTCGRECHLCRYWQENTHPAASAQRIQLGLKTARHVIERRSFRLSEDDLCIGAEGPAMSLRCHRKCLKLIAGAIRLFLAILIASVAEPAEAKTSTVSGVIFTLGSDQKQTVWPNARVSLKNLDTNNEIATVSNDLGTYAFVSVLYGNYADHRYAGWICTGHEAADDRERNTLQASTFS